MKLKLIRLICKLFGHRTIGFCGYSWCERCNKDYKKPYWEK